MIFRPRTPTGFTLLELMLALSISAIIMGAVGMAIHLHLRVMDARRVHVEEAQLARAILRRLADDLHGCVQQELSDFSSVPALLQSTGVDNFNIEDLDGLNDPEADPNDLLNDILGGSSDSGVEDTGSDSNSNSGNAQSDPEEENPIASSVAPPSIIGLYGNPYELQIDVSRLPRIDEYDQSLAGDAVITDIPSDVKTVAWYLRNDNLQTSSGVILDQQGVQDTGIDQGARGLVRRELDRAVTSWAADQGSLDDLKDAGELLAPEVTALGFRYFDGNEWLTTWNSEEAGGLPVAVEIALAIEPRNALEAQRAAAATARSTRTDASGPSTFVGARPGDLIFRLVVHLMVGKPVEVGE